MAPSSRALQVVTAMLAVIAAASVPLSRRSEAYEATTIDMGRPTVTAKSTPRKTAPREVVEEPQEFDFSKDPSQGCVELPLAVCMGNTENGGTAVRAANNLPKGIVGLWNFDDAAAQDSSGRMNRMSPIPDFGPGFSGAGASAFLHRNSPVTSIPHIGVYSSLELSISFWLFLVEDPGFGVRTIIHKGDSTQFAPAISYSAENKKLEIRVSTSPTDVTSFTSQSSIPIRRWTHIAYVAQLEVVRLYVNGILDTKLLLPDMPYHNQGRLYIGRDPWSRMSLSMYIDNLHIYARRLDKADISTIGDAAFPGVGSSMVRLGCTTCPLAKAEKSCEEKYHMCDEGELASTGKMIARSMGWTNSETTFWHKGSIDPSGSFKTALCCADH